MRVPRETRVLRVPVMRPITAAFTGEDDPISANMPHFEVREYRPSNLPTVWTSDDPDDR